LGFYWLKPGLRTLGRLVDVMWAAWSSGFSREGVIVFLPLAGSGWGFTG